MPPNERKIVGNYTINNNQTVTFGPHIEVAIHGNGSFDEKTASEFGTRIADATIDSLYSAFERRGMFSLKGSRLKP